MRLTDLLLQGKQELSFRGIEGAHTAARALLCHALEKTEVQLYACAHDEATESVQVHYDSFLKRRILGEPLAYILGEKEFYGRSFLSDPRALIPRPETELIVDTVKYLVKQKKLSSSSKCLDLCTGSGVVPISCILEENFQDFMASDIDPSALDLATENMKRHGVTLTLLQSDLFSGLLPKQNFDLITANPPYVDPAEENQLKRELAFEPKHALFAGQQGLQILNSIAKLAPQHLAQGGILLMEFGFGQHDCVMDILKRQGAYGQIQFHQDLSGKLRCVEARVC